MQANRKGFPFLADLRKPSSRRALSMTSLIDVIFLLLLFFMLSSTFTRFAELELGSAAQSARAATETPPVLLQLGQSEIRLNANPVAFSELGPALQILGAAQVLISLGADVEAQRLVDLLVALSGLPDLPDLTVTVLEPRS